MHLLQLFLTLVLGLGTAHALVCDPSCCGFLECGGGGSGGAPSQPCYETKTPIGPPAVTLTVTDEFGVHTARLDYIRDLCPPIAPQPLDGLHKIFAGVASDSLSAPKNDTRTYSTPLGSITADMGSLRFVELDAPKERAPGQPAPLHAVEARTCYGFTLPHPNFTLHWGDQFGGDHEGVAHEAALLCLPAQVGAMQATTTRVCFQMAIGGPGARYNLTTPLGAYKVDVAHSVYWCGPATRVS